VRAHEAQIDELATASPSAVESAARTPRISSLSSPGEAEGGLQETALAIRDAERALAQLREQFERTADRAAQAQLATQALDVVERELALADRRRRALDAIEGTLWRRRNRIERVLIDIRGRDWWQARREASRRQALATSKG